MKVLIGTKNGGKIEGAKLAFEQFYDNVEVTGIAVPSEVNEQPINEETYYGGYGRVKNLKEYADTNELEADFFVAIESGMTNWFGHWHITNIAVIEDRKGNFSIGTSPGFPVPERLVDRIKEIGLSEVMNEVFFSDNNRRNSKGGIALLTKDTVSRIDLTRLAFTMALTKFLNKEWRD